MSPTAYWKHHRCGSGWHTSPVAAERKALWLQFHPGDFVGCGKDHTLYALKDGIVIFKKTKYIKKVRAGKNHVFDKACTGGRGWRLVTDQAAPSRGCSCSLRVLSKQSNKDRAFCLLSGSSFANQQSVVLRSMRVVDVRKAPRGLRRCRLLTRRTMLSRRASVCSPAAASGSGTSSSHRGRSCARRPMQTCWRRWHRSSRRRNGGAGGAWAHRPRTCHALPLV